MSGTDHRLKSARRRGALAYRLGKPVSANPFVGVDAAMWREGWLAAQAEQREASPVSPLAPLTLLSTTEGPRRARARAHANGHPVPFDAPIRS